ncbi:MAG TPA: hypothetical protein VI911_09400 [Patescibacteria group bacterium]|nr:hypothetical protein [Patescibacteria group bacterium]
MLYITETELTAIPDNSSLGNLWQQDFSVGEMVQVTAYTSHVLTFWTGMVSSISERQYKVGNLRKVWTDSPMVACPLWTGDSLVFNRSSKNKKGMETSRYNSVRVERLTRIFFHDIIKQRQAEADAQARLDRVRGALQGICVQMSSLTTEDLDKLEVAVGIRDRILLDNLNVHQKAREGQFDSEKKP